MNASRRAELLRLVPKYYLSDNRITTASAATKFGVSDSTIRRYLILAKVPIRNTWSRKAAVIDGKKLCPICKVIKPVSTGYYLRARGSPYTYCKDCDRVRAVLCCKKSRHIKAQRKLKIKDAIRKSNIEARELLKEAAYFIKQISDYAPIVDRIESFFISEKNMLTLLESKQ